jgi:hypothetical protein
MAKMYAWTTFRTEIDENGQTKKAVKPGEEVTQSKLGVSNDEWDYLIENGAVREDEYPDIEDTKSPAEHIREQLRKPLRDRVRRTEEIEMPKADSKTEQKDNK